MKIKFVSNLDLLFVFISSLVMSLANNFPFPSALQLFKEVGFKELLFTSDGQHSLENALKLRPHPDVLLTVNFMHDTNGLDMLEELQVRWEWLDGHGLEECCRKGS